jgi:hypothetical protein
MACRVSLVITSDGSVLAQEMSLTGAHFYHDIAMMIQID